MCSDGGQPVDDRPCGPLASRGILVDNHAVPVHASARRPGRADGVDERWTTRGGLSGPTTPSSGRSWRGYPPSTGAHRYHRHSSILEEEEAVMKIICSREALLREVSIAQEVVSSRNSLSVLSNVLLTARRGALVIQATDLKVGFETSIPVEVVTEGTRDGVLRQAAEHRALAARGRRGDRAGRRGDAAGAGPRRGRSTSSCAASPPTSTPRSRRRRRSCTSTSPRRTSSRWSRAPSSRCPTTRPATS